MKFDVKTLLLGGAALVIALGAGYGIARVTSPAPAPAAAAAEAGESGEHAAEGGEEHAEGFVAMTPARLASAGIQTETISAGGLSAQILAQATVTAPPQGRASVAARADGAITRIFKRLGDPVTAGETVALLESREASTIAAERAGAQARVTAAQAALTREQRLFGQRITSRQDLEAAQSLAAQAQAELRRTQAAAAAAGVTADGRSIAVRSLISGRITKVDAELGAFVPAGTELFEVTNPRLIQIEAAMSPSDAQRVAPGDRAIIELPSGAVLAATVRSAAPSVSLESRAATVVLSPVSVPPGLVQGQSVRVRITPRGTPAAGGLVVPEVAVQSVEGRDVVFVRVANGFQATPVTVGARTGGRVEILSGIQPGSTIATTGAFVMKSELGASEAEH